jgi:hypothetical protein
MDKTSPKNRGRFVYFVKKSGTDCPSPRGLFVTGTPRPGDALSRGHLVQGKVRPGHVASRERFDQGSFHSGTLHPGRLRAGTHRQGTEYIILVEDLCLNFFPLLYR